MAPAGCVAVLLRSVKSSPALVVVVRVLMSVWHLRMLADPERMFLAGLLPMHFVPVGFLVLLLLLLPVWFLLVLLVVAEFVLMALSVASVLVELTWLLWLFLVLLLLVGCLLSCQWGGCCTRGCLLMVPLLLMCLSVAWSGMVVVPGELLLELLVGVRWGRELLMVVPVLLSMVCSLLVVALLLVVPVAAVSLMVPLTAKSIVVI